MSSISSTKGKGWLKDYPDFRDNTPSTSTISQRQKLRGVKEPIVEILKKLNPPVNKKKSSAKKNHFN